MSDARLPLVLTVDQRDEVLSILNSGYQKKQLFLVVRADRLLRQFNHVLKFSIPAQALYTRLAGFMGADKTRGRDEVQVGVDVMARWLGIGNRGVQKVIRELTLSGSLPLIQKRIPGGLGHTTLYAFVRDPFALAAKQADAAEAGGSRNVSTRPRIAIVDQRRCFTPGQVEWFASWWGQDPKDGDGPDSREFYALKRHLYACEVCEARVDEAYSKCLKDAA